MSEQFFEEEKNLSASETIIMKAVWDAGEDISIPDLIEVLKKDYDKEYARTTVVTFLLKLSAKGFVKTYRKGKLSYAHAIKTQDEYKAKLMNEETDFWFEGRISSLLSALCSTRKLTKEDIAEIRSMLDDVNTHDNY